ncbi:MAG: SH3 domain-containing protein [Lachnospiraceae bacterium]|nr:SH3 domain-containing protein [Lachnospiraceae bacterium]
MANSDLDYDFDDIDISDREGSSRRSRNSGSRGARRRKKAGRRKKRGHILSKILPPFIAIALIAAVVFWGLKTGLFDSFSYSTKEEDLFAYFGASDNDTAVVVVNGEPTEGRIRVVNGHLYMPYTDIKSLYTDRFFYEISENSVKYTTEADTTVTVVGENGYTNASGMVSTDHAPVIKEGSGEEEQLLMSLDYLKLFINMSANLFGGNGEPYRAEIKTAWGNKNTASVTKDHALRTGEDKKSNILKELKEGDTVTVLDEGDASGDWMRVQTEDLISGYAEKRYIGTVSETAETPVNDVPEERFTSLTSDTPIVLMWHSIAGAAGNDTIYSALEGTRGIDVLAPTWFSVAGADGTVSSIASADYVNTAHSRGIKVWAAFDDFNSDISVSMYELLNDPARRASMISSVISKAGEAGVDGINVDFERISQDSGEAFIQFIRELSIECHKNGLVVSVDNYVPRAYNTFYHRKEQGIFTDYVIIMGYDETYAGSAKAGSVASINYVKEGIEETIKEVPNYKVINGLPFYTRVWEETPKTDEEIAASDASGEFIPYNLSVLATPSLKQEEELLANYHAVPTWDQTTMQNYATWSIGEKTYEVWLEDAASLTAKLEFMKAFELGGAAGWEISLAAPYVWDVLEQYY